MTDTVDKSRRGWPHPGIADTGHPFATEFGVHYAADKWGTSPSPKDPMTAATALCTRVRRTPLVVNRDRGVSRFAGEPAYGGTLLALDTFVDKCPPAAFSAPELLLRLRFDR